MEFLSESLMESLSEANSTPFESNIIRIKYFNIIEFLQKFINQI